MERNSYDIIADAVKAYWESHYPCDVVAFFFQKYSYEMQWEWMQELVECHNPCDYERMEFLHDFCEGQTNVRDITIVSLADVMEHYAKTKLNKEPPKEDA